MYVKYVSGRGKPMLRINDLTGSQRPSNVPCGYLARLRMLGKANQAWVRDAEVMKNR